MRRILILFFLLFCAFGIVTSYFYWPKVQKTFKKGARPSKEEEHRDQATARQLLSEGKGDQVFAIIKKYDDYINGVTPEGKEWMDILITASEQTKNSQQLVILYEYFPDLFEKHEEAALLIEHAYLSAGRFHEFEDLRQRWKGKETKKSAWFLLDGDKLLLDGKQQEAFDYFKSQTLTGSDETNRLLRLSWIIVNQDPKSAWNYLTEAQQKDPKNSLVRIYRARLLEAAQKTSLALAEYIAAIQTSPENIGLRDQLGEFFRRYRQYPKAVQVWTESLALPGSDFMWLKAWFWSHVTVPLDFDWKSPSADSSLKPLIDYLLTLKKGEFWNQKAFDKIPNGNAFLKSQQVTFWLRLLQALKEGDEKGALELLQFNVFKKNSWNLDLENAIQRILAYRKTGSLTLIDPQTQKQQAELPQDNSFAPENFVNQRSSFFKQLDEFAKASSSEKPSEQKIPEDLQKLLKGQEAFVGPFLAVGWLEAALEMNKMTKIPSDYPDWIAYGLTQALRFNRSTDAALEFAKNQKPTPGLNLLIAELLITKGDINKSIDILQPLAKEDNDIGNRALWMLALINTDKKDFAKAKALIQSNPKFQESTIGQETLARIALMEGNTAEADRIYQAIEKPSAEAKSYLARKAFNEKNWKRAKELTQQLLLEFPTNLMIRQNLEKILEEEAKDNTATSSSNPKANPMSKTPPPTSPYKPLKLPAEKKPATSLEGASNF